MLWKLTAYRWNWIDNGLLPYTLAALRALAIWAPLRLAAELPGSAGAVWMTLPTILGLLAAGTLCAQYGAYSPNLAKVGNLRKVRAPLIVALGGLAGVALALYLGFGAGRLAVWDPRWLRLLAQHPGQTALTLLVAVWCWWLGIRAGRERVYHETYYANFAAGLVALALAVGLAYAMRPELARSLVLALLTFFGVGLAALAIASLETTRSLDPNLTDQPFTLTRYWLATVAAVIGAVLIFGLLAGRLFAPRLVEQLLAGLAVALDLAAHVVWWVMYGVAFVVFAVLDPLMRFLLAHRKPGEQPQIGMPQSLADQLKDLQQGPAAGAPALYLAAKILGGVLLVAIIVGVFILAFRRFQTYAQEDVDEARESIFSADLLKQQLSGLLRRRRKPGPGRPFATLVGDDPVARVRRVYQALLAWAAARGVARPAGATPAEYAVLLRRELDVDPDAVAAITTLYEVARYSAGALSPALADQAEAAWLRATPSPSGRRPG